MNLYNILWWVALGAVALIGYMLVAQTAYTFACYLDPCEIIEE
jgi:hypothetical protein